MKQTTKMLFMVLIVFGVTLFVGCKNEPETTSITTSIKVGDLGPAGGYIFYDCDADNDYGNYDGLISAECGWRYLEAAPADLKVVNGVPTVDSSVSGYSYAESEYWFGYYRSSDSGSNLYVNGTWRFNSSDCTGTAIGTGKSNTRLLVDAMGTEVYKLPDGSQKTGDYAAKLCDILEYTVNGVTYDDWFLPSKEELSSMYWNLKSKGLGGFSNNKYWSSSENDYYYAIFVWKLDFGIGNPSYDSGRGKDSKVRPVRAF